MERVETSRRVIGAGGQAGERPVPSAVFWLGRPPSAALAVGESARQASAMRTGRPQQAALRVSLIIFVLRIFTVCSFRFLVLVGLFGLIAIQFRVELGTILMRLPKSSPHFRLTRGSSWNLEIALSGVSAKVQPLGLIQPCRRCVETSG